MIEGAGMLTLCAEMFGGCMTGPLDYSAHSWDGTNIALSGTDQFGGFSLTGVAKNGKTVMDKTYDNGMNASKYLMDEGQWFLAEAKQSPISTIR